ncbi:MAG: glutamine amidotransferase [Candidatus Melainabacteria bacterium]|nr:glutamine amidotransferase [Candidatus Melainabacteria bacterium]
MQHYLNLAYLYPTLLNIYGDRGNVLTLLKRCEARQIELAITSINIGDQIDDPSKFDMYFIGGGQDQQQTLVAEELKKIASSLITAIENNAVFLAVCGGYQLLGKYYKTHEGLEIKGIDALDLHTIAGSKRMIGNVLCTEIESNFSIVGFENHSGKTYLGDNLQPLAKVIRGFGNNGEDGFEGVRYKNVFGTYLHGSLLPKNPMLTDKLIELACNKKGLSMQKIQVDNLLEEKAHEKAMKLKY